LRPGHLEKLARIVQAGGDRDQTADRLAENLLFLAQLLGPLRIAPDGGIGERRVYFLQPSLLALEVKDTSAARPTACRDR
jgi:hypothetical protein